jgi:SSS family transporter
LAEHSRTIGLTGLDYVVVGVYLAAVIVLGSAFSRRKESTEGYLLGGRRMPWWLIGVSYIASLLSTISMVGAPGEAYKNGLTAALSPVLGLFFSLGFFFLVIRFDFQTNTFTPFEYLERRFGAASRGLAAGLYCLARGLYLATVLFAAGKVFEGTSQWPAGRTIVAIGAIGVFYTTLGGMRAVVWTEFLQFLVMVGGIAIIVFRAVSLMPGGVFDVFAFAGEQSHLFPDFELASFYSLSPCVRLTLWMIVLRAVADHLFYKSADQVIIQKMLSTSGYWQAFRSVVLGSVLGVLVLLVLYFVGLCMFRFYAQLPPSQRPAADLALFQFIATELPPPLPGLIVAAMVAAIMSTITSGFNSLASVATKDFYLRFVRPGSSDSAQVIVSRVMTVVSGALIVAAALAIERLAASVGGTVIESSGVWMSLLVVLAPVFLIGATVRRARQWHMLVAMAVGFAVTGLLIAWYYHVKQQGGEAGFHVVAVAAFLATLSAGYGLALISRRRPSGEPANLTLWTLKSRDGPMRSET